MSGLRTTLSATVFVSALLLSAAARAGDVTVDYSQLDNWSSARSIVLHPLLAQKTTAVHPLAHVQTNTVQNLASETPREAIHLTPPTPKTFATLTAPRAPALPATPITEIDFSLAALPPAPKPEPVLADAPVMEPVKQPEAETEVAKVETPVVPAPAKKELAKVVAPVAPAPAKTWTSSTPMQPIQARAVVSKMDDLRPEDVVAIDIGAPPKQTISQ